MIVKCDRCQTRFKVPDEKVSETGTNVRCTRCQNTFRVWRTASTAPVDTFGELALPRVDAPSRERLPAVSAAGDIESPKTPRPNGSSGNGASAATAQPGLLGDVPEFVEAQAGPGSRAPSTQGAVTAQPSRPSGITRAIEQHVLAQSSSTQTAGQRESGTALSARAATTPARSRLGVAANVFIAAALVAMLLWVGAIYIHEGKFGFSSLSGESWKSLLTGPGELLAVDVSNGLYETSGGKHVFYVRGEVENRGSSPKRARVRVEILDGSLALTRAEVVAGAAPNSEELYGVSSVTDLDALNAQLEKASADVSPGKRVPFLVAFYEYPPDLSQYRLRVTVRDAREGAR